MKNIAKGFMIVCTLLIVVSCNKEVMMQSNQPEVCDLHEYTGSWNFIVNGDVSTEYVGQIDKFSDSILNIAYQPSTAFDYFFQTEVNCEDGVIFEQLPAGNHGTRTIEGSISLTDFFYQDSTYINFTGEPSITVRRIEGIKL